MIVGAAYVRFSEPKAKVDITKEQVFLTPISDKPIPVNWDDSTEVEIKISDLQKAPVEDFPFILCLQLLKKQRIILFGKKTSPIGCLGCKNFSCLRVQI